MPDIPVDRLRLLAQDEEDLAVFSAHMQDAVVRVCDMTFLPKTNVFALVGSRFDWVAAAQGRLERCQVGLHFDRVLKASRKGLDAAKPADDAPCLLVGGDGGVKGKGPGAGGWGRVDQGPRPHRAGPTYGLDDQRSPAARTCPGGLRRGRPSLPGDDEGLRS